MAEPREITPWSANIPHIDRTSRPEVNEDDARDIAPILLFGSLEFHEAQSIPDLRPKPAPALVAVEAKEVVETTEVDPKVLSGSSATSSAASSPDDSDKNGSTQLKGKIPLGTHPSSLSDNSEDPASAEKDPSPEPLLLL